MSQFYDQSSLVFLPSGYKDGKLYSQKPLSTSGELTFSRGSDIEATRVAANGFIQKAQVNLVTYSNSYNNWVNTSTTDTSGQTGYDGSSDAWLLSKSATDGRMGIAVSGSGLVTMSIYAKAGTSNWIKLSIASTGQVYAFFNLSSGVLGSVGTSVIDSTITSVGSGWHRVSMTFSGSYGAFNIWVADADNDTSGTSGNIYIQDAQLNYGLVAQTYQETTTAAVVSGITDNMPRLNYDPANPTCPSLLLEKSSTNLVADSENFSDSSYVLNAATIAINAAISPDGYNNANNLIENTAASQHRFIKTTSLGGSVDSSAYVISIFVKNIGRNVRLYDSNQSVNGITDFNLQTKSVISGTGKIEDYGNGWLRLSIYPLKDTSTTSSFFLQMMDEAGAIFYTGDGTSGVSLYGTQIEAGSYPTSYIPTYGASATRTADACSKTGISSLIGATEGTLFVEAKVTLGGRLMLIGSTGNFIEILTNAAGKANGFVYNGATQANILSTATYATGDTLKIALAYKANDFALYVNGTAQGTDTSGAIPSSMAQLIINDYLSAGYNTANEYKQALLFTSRLSNADLATLTTL